MAIKKQPVLTKEDFEAALIELRLSVSEVSRETGLPRHIVSHFRGYGDGLKPEQAAKLRDYFESKGVEFTDENEPQPKNLAAPTSNRPPIQQENLLSRSSVIAFRHFFIDERLTDTQIEEAASRFEGNYDQVAELLGHDLNTDFASDDYDEDTENKLRELWGLLAGIGVLTLHIQGRFVVNVMPSEGKPKTLGDLLTGVYRDIVTGLNDQEKQEEFIKVEEQEEVPA
ncbi:MAG: hypothetical protein Q8N54_00345 [Sulfurimicrobium sp.]|nr:hypothetical protein [Sulfurimicrobium sp.]MDP1703409.1 hypothetical protein [Sulfurimicrobium sp.]MDP2198415.1 hypothetical protein [Sulfurimicrobium sp.]MDP2961178.1 hypothetical protein [Sulfurimicrobium sp.]MDP3689222.1 hypothetical protein [Sulfurimicrobium sp.]